MEQNRPRPPAYLRRWRHLVILVMKVFEDVARTASQLARYMARPIMINLVEAIRVQNEETPMFDSSHLLETYRFSGPGGAARMAPPARDKKPTAAERLADQAACPHSTTKEYTNWAGTFKKCTCELRWRWNKGSKKWEVHRSREDQAIVAPKAKAKASSASSSRRSSRSQASSPADHSTSAQPPPSESSEAWQTQASENSWAPEHHMISEEDQHIFPDTEADESMNWYVAQEQEDEWQL